MTAHLPVAGLSLFHVRREEGFQARAVEEQSCGGKSRLFTDRQWVLSPVIELQASYVPVVVGAGGGQDQPSLRIDGPARGGVRWSGRTACEAPWP